MVQNSGYGLCLLFLQSFLISLDSVGPDVLLSFLKDSEKPTNVFKLFENIVGRKTTNILLDALCCNILRYIWYHTVHTLTYLESQDTKWYKSWFAWFQHQEHILWSYTIVYLPHCASYWKSIPQFVPNISQNVDKRAILCVTRLHLAIFFSNFSHHISNQATPVFAKKLSQMQDGQLATEMNIFPARSSAQEGWGRKNNRNNRSTTKYPAHSEEYFSLEYKTLV